MTRRDFELIARVIRSRREMLTVSGDERAAQPYTLDVWGKGWNAAHTALARDFADELAQTNARFDRERFLKACGVDS